MMKKHFQHHWFEYDGLTTPALSSDTSPLILNQQKTIIFFMYLSSTLYLWCISLALYTSVNDFTIFNRKKMMTIRR